MWGGTHKTSLLKLERAQRAVLKVGYSLPWLFPTTDLYRYTEVLSVRKLFILNTVLKQHSKTTYDPSLFANKRVKHKVCHSTTKWNTAFAKRFYGFLGTYLYNKINKNLNIYPLTNYQCKKSTVEWLKTLDYVTTEELLPVSI